MASRGVTNAGSRKVLALLLAVCSLTVTDRITEPPAHAVAETRTTFLEPVLEAVSQACEEVPAVVFLRQVEVKAVVARDDE